MTGTKRCVDCGKYFDPDDDEARCPASGNTAYHRTAAEAKSDEEAGR